MLSDMGFINLRSHKLLAKYDSQG